MNHEDWNEDKIEEILKNAPKIHDTRSKEEIFERLKKDGIFDEEPPKKMSKKRINLVPGLIAACAILLLAFLVPSFMKNENLEEATTSNEILDSAESTDMNILSTQEKGEKVAKLMTMETDIKTSVYPEQLEGNTVFSIGLASDAADSIPVTILIPNEKVMEDLGKSNPTQVELYNEYAPQLNEKLLGFTDYHPYVGQISEEHDKVIHKLPNDHPYDEASATLSTYYASLTNTFSSYDEVEFVDENNQPIHFSEAGEKHSLLLHDESKQYGYFKYVQQDGGEYLAPNFRETYTTVEEAMEALKTTTNDIYQSVILPDVDYTAKENVEIVKITFKTEFDLNNYNQVEVMQMIEAILLTASGFEKAVQFENIAQTEWQGFDFTKPLPIPVGPNELPYTVLESN